MTASTWKPDVAEGIQVAGGTVYLEVFTSCNEACPNSAKQRRGYAYQSGGFRQVSGPTSFPPIPAVPLIDAGNTTLGFSFGTGAVHASGHVRMVDGAGQARFYISEYFGRPVQSVRVEVTLGPTALGKLEGEDILAAILTITDEWGGARKIAYVFSKATTGSPGPLHGTLLVASGDHAWNYRPARGGLDWEWHKS